MEGKDEAGAGGGWSRCIYSQEAERDEVAHIEFTFSIPELQPVEWYQPHLGWLFLTSMNSS